MYFHYAEFVYITPHSPNLASCITGINPHLVVGSLVVSGLFLLQPLDGEPDETATLGALQLPLLLLHAGGGGHDVQRLGIRGFCTTCTLQQ